jgi:hypothetical protein
MVPGDSPGACARAAHRDETCVPEEHMGTIPRACRSNAYCLSNRRLISLVVQ